ncbi:ATP-dependent DNA helicase RecG [Phycisphaerales bacterium AB-hyl4]|uniref:Probable DNA 3'-5' helicase RecG n=1 Tax=Natronomicrosphaera hydrolytica TaxID=3242702 RepID=A0ABV4U3D2_9BACT
MADASTDNSASDLRLTSPVRDITGVGERRAALLRRLGINIVSDLLRHLPMRYEFEAAEDQIAQLPVEGVGMTRGTIEATRFVPGYGRGGRGKGRFEATLADPNGRLKLTWFSGGHLRRRIMAGMHLRVQGKVTRFGDYLQMVNPKWEPLEELDTTPAEDERLRPVYPATEDLPSTAIEQIVRDVLPSVIDQVRDPIPIDLLQHHNMPSLADAFRMSHMPEHEEQWKAARRRLAYNELLLLQLGIAMKRAHVREHLAAPVLKHNDAIDQHIRQRFPFPLTRAQDKVVHEIVGDLGETRPMNRLLQGDVGSGKTVVALYAMLMAVSERKQAALMAPTELLAEQHHLSITNMLDGANVRTALLTGSQPAPNSAERKALLEKIAAGELDILVGTHALLGGAVRFADLAVAVIDEQHRFGVHQRAALRRVSSSEFRVSSSDDAPASTTGTPPNSKLETRNSKLNVPHQLVMTATPIPRTLSLTIFGDLDVSLINELPPGRTPIVNRLVDPGKADDVYSYVRQRLERGEQAYVVVPAIDASGTETTAQLKTVREHAKLLEQRFFEGYEVAAVHGRLKRDTRERIMDRFRRGKIHVLVATTVIEVGVDVSNASVMVIEHAERFGLAQLHQLRGRVGRSSDGRRSLCVFIANPTTDDARKRLDAIANTNDGFRIAEMDLEIRGMGEFFGTRQSGLPPLRVARIPEDMDLLMLARRDAIAMIDADPDLAREGRAMLRRILLQQYGEALGLIDVG